VGLDAAKIKVESLGGTLEIDTKPNEGTTLSFRLPLTTAIVQAMLVNAGGETYCIPSSHIAETIKIAQQDIKTIDRHEVISYRDTVLPLIRVGERFGFASSTTQFSVSQASAGASGISVVVVEAGVEKMGLIVDKFLGQQEIVIKPLTGMLKGVKGASGMTILGTGKPAIVMDVGSSLKKEVLI
jgi:two-component system chemotaxis sensor kinase CheA